MAELEIISWRNIIFTRGAGYEKLPLEDGGLSPGDGQVARLLVPDGRMGEDWRGEAGQSGGVVQAEAVIRRGHTVVGP